MSAPKIAQKGPYTVKEGVGKRAWCQCGLSKTQPYCDGSHRGTGIGPLIETFTEPKTVAWCGCKQSKTKPYCDGTHAEL